MQPIGDVTLRERREGERLAERYVDELVALGAGSCTPLRLADPGDSRGVNHGLPVVGELAID
jgi:hypothetical protein